LNRRAKFPESPSEELKPILDRIAKLFALTESPYQPDAEPGMSTHTTTKGELQMTGFDMQEKLEQLNDIVLAEYKKLHDSDIPEISSTDIAEKVYAAIDPQSISPPPARLAALLTLKDLAEELLEERHRKFLRSQGEAAIAQVDALDAGTDAETDQLITAGKKKWFMGEDADGNNVYGMLDQNDRNGKVKSLLMELEFYAGYPLCKRHPGSHRA
jgi:hypothetical protein